LVTIVPPVAWMLRLLAPRGCSTLPGETWPIEPPPEENAAQLMPDWNEVESVTSTIFASSITWRSTARRVARR
jgi:hypothetical protein